MAAINTDSVQGDAPKSTNDAHAAVRSTAPARPLTDGFWKATADLRRAIDNLEFLTRLGDGTLPLVAFRRYLEQDALYLAGYARALSILASRAPDADTAVFWSTSAAEAITVERSLHEGLLSGGALPELPPTAPEDAATPTCLAYVSYLIATAATAPYAVAAAAVLPCYWVYADVSSRLAVTAADVLAADPSHPYAQWVANYDAEGFQSAVDTAISLVEKAGEHSSADEHAAMGTAFTLATRYELLFWDTALNEQPWPDISASGPASSAPVSLATEGGAL